MHIERGEGADAYTLGADWAVQYDTERGVMQEFINGVVRSETLVRAGLIDQLTREAVVIELERLGYTIIAPEAQT